MLSHKLVHVLFPHGAITGDTDGAQVGTVQGSPGGLGLDVTRGEVGPRDRLDTATVANACGTTGPKGLSPDNIAQGGGDVLLLVRSFLCDGSFHFY